MKKILIILLLLFSFPLLALKFKNGVHLINQDNRVYKVIYTDNSGLSTAICWVSRSSKKIKNGIVPAVMRSVKGFKIISRSTEMVNSKITALVSPETRIYCLCARGCSLEIVGIEKIGFIQNKIILIKDGKVIISSNKKNN